MRVTQCRSCKAAVVWAATEADKAMPVDAEPREDGNIVLDFIDEQARPRARYLVDGQLSLDVGAARYVSHFVTCPDAEAWRTG